MARFWKEKLDPNKHTDFMKTMHVGGFPVGFSFDNLNSRWVYFVHVCSFTFQFQSLQQIEECLVHFSQKIHPSSMLPDVTLEHDWQSWEQRLPYWLFEEPKRKRVVKALQCALRAFEKEFKTLD